MKQQPTDTVPFFPWIRDLVHCRVKRPANNGVIQSNENHPAWMFSWGCWTAGINGRGVLSFSVCSTNCALCFGAWAEPQHTQELCNVWPCWIRFWVGKQSLCLNAALTLEFETPIALRQKEKHVCCVQFVFRYVSLRGFTYQMLYHQQRQ